MIEQLDKAISDGYVRCQPHPTAPLTIYNYSEQCQFKRAWTPITLAARGLILDDLGNVVARGFQKFFNLSEHGPYFKLPDEEYKVLDKLDGSLGILYFVEGKPSISTRGSFTGLQAVRATEIFNKKYKDYQPPSGCTALFEIILPEDRKVVDYGKTEDLFHIGLVDNSTGLAKYDIDSNWPGPKVKELEPLPPDKLGKQIKPNAEGFVVKFRSGFQVKIKLEEYCRLHRLMYCTSTKSIWEHLASGGGLLSLIEGVPDELMPFIKEHEYKLRMAFGWVEEDSLKQFLKIRHLADESRKAFADAAMKYKHPSILFSMLDGKDYKKTIWKMLEPEWVPAKAPPSEDVA